MFPIVLAHNDAQENNILMSLANNRDLMVIDYEYAGWNPMAMDLANYLNETMLDNAHPFKNGIHCYPQNCMTRPELTQMASSYLQVYFNQYASASLKSNYANSLHTFLDRELPRFIHEVLACALLNNFFWGVWALALLSPQNCAGEKLFNYDFTAARLEMFAAILELQQSEPQTEN